MLRLMRIGADDNINGFKTSFNYCHLIPSLMMPGHPLREDRIMKRRARQAPVKSHLARFQGEMMVDTSMQ